MIVRRVVEYADSECLDWLDDDSSYRFKDYNKQGTRTRKSELHGVGDKNVTDLRILAG